MSQDLAASSAGDALHEMPTVREERAEDFDSTPKSEVPVTVTVMTPGAVEEAVAQGHAGSNDISTDYFTAQPAITELQLQLDNAINSPNLTSAPNTTASASAINAMGTIEPPDPDADAEVAAAAAAKAERPAPYTNASSMSIESTDSSVTVTAIAPALRPNFPNQAYAALSEQQHKRYVPPLLRQRTAHPVHINTWTNALASSGRSSLGVRTAGNSPAPTPAHGLFDLNEASQRDEYGSTDHPGTYSSPYLHFTHQHVPKETHVAEVEVDLQTGRKIINNYEILDEIGRGTHGKVKLGRNLKPATSDETYVAIKIVERYSKKRKLGRLGQPEDKVKKEVAILKKTRHPNVVALLEVIDDPNRKKVYIVLEWVSKGQIHWRQKSLSKEVTMVEARRYERERVQVDMQDEHNLLKEEAVMNEVHRRLARGRRRELSRYRQNLRREAGNPAAFSHETVGDFESEDGSEEDRLSRVSSTSIPLTARSFPGEGRLPSRPATPAERFAVDRFEDVETPTAEQDHYLPLTPDPPEPSPASTRRGTNCYTGLEGTMYGAYDPSSGENSRAVSRHSSEDLSALAKEILDTELNRELEYVPVMTLQQVRVAFRDTLLGLQYLHYQGIVHRDIKPPNLLSTKDHRVKISDFGVSYLGKASKDDEGEDISEHEAQELEEARELAKTVGTPAFFAPELCINESDEALPVTKAIDVWALGITMFCMIFARTPFVDNEFVVMRQIAEEEVYIPRKRLVPVVLKPPSRPSSRSRNYHKMPSGRRDHHDLEYEAIDDDLYDLFKRLLTKDPRQRITLEEVRHHPWVVADLRDKVKWLDETDPASWNEGKIQVSKEDVNAAVVPLMDRVRSFSRKVGEKLGLTRARAHSNTGSASGGSPNQSAHSSSSAINQDARRQSLRGEDAISAALQKSREGSDHPLSNSATVSPEPQRQPHYFDDAGSHAGSEADDNNNLRPNRSRPNPPDRSQTMMSTSTSGSVRTVRPSDFRSRGRESPPPSPGLPGTPLALDSPGGSALSAVFGSGATRRVLNSLRERSSGRSPGASRKTSEQGSMDSLGTHAEPSLAVSNASASGQVNPPDALREAVPSDDVLSTSALMRVSSSRAPDDDGSNPSRPASLSRKSSSHSISSIGRWLTRQKSTSSRASLRSNPRMTAPESSAEDWKRADTERIRRLIQENEQASAKSEDPRKHFDDRECPPSPDDQRPSRISRQPSMTDVSNPVSSIETSPAGNAASNHSAIASSSSEIGSAMSASVSNPSIPSAMSKNSSVDPMDSSFPSAGEDKSNDSSDGTVNGQSGDFYDEGYHPDMSSALNSDDEYESSSDSDGGLVMSRRKSKAAFTAVKTSSENTPQRDRRDTGVAAPSKKSSRSGSNNTMRKIRTRESEDGRRPRSSGISED